MTDAGPTQQARILWQIAFDHEVTAAPLAIADGVLVPLGHAGSHALRRVSLDGEVRWEVPLPARPVGTPVRSGGLVAVPLERGQVLGVDLDSGQLATRWRPLNAALSPPIAALGGHVYARAGRGGEAELVALSPRQDTPAWRAPDPTGGATRALLRHTDGVLVLAGDTAAERSVVARGLRPVDGETLWTHTEGDCELNDLWAVGGIIDLVTSSQVTGLDARSGLLRNARFSSFPLEDARASGEHLIVMMDGHTGPVLMCFDLVSQRLHGRVSRAMVQLVAVHPNEALVTLVNGDPALYALPALEPVALPEAHEVGTPRYAAWARDVCYIVAEHRRSLTAIDLDVTGSGQRQPITRRR